MTTGGDHEKLAIVEILRSLAILGVVSIHSLQITKLVSEDQEEFHTFKLLDFGRYGPQLFFVISGYLMCRIYDGKKLSFRNYTLKRIARIYPLWLAFLTIYLVESIVLKAGDVYASIGKPILLGTVVQEISYLHVIILSFTFLLFCSAPLWNQVIPGGWSIQSEVWHYASFPFLVKISTTKLLAWCCLLNLIARAVFNLDISNGSRLGTFAIESFLRLSYPSTVSFFVLGMCASRIQRDRRWIYSWTNLMTLSFFFLTVSITPAPFGSNFEALFFIVLSALTSVFLVQSAMVKRVFSFISRYSFFTYFFHFLILDLIVFLTRRNEITFAATQSFLSFTLIFFTTLTFSMLFGRFSWIYFEKPLINMAKRMSERGLSS